MTVLFQETAMLNKVDKNTHLVPQWNVYKTQFQGINSPRINAQRTSAMFPKSHDKRLQRILLIHIGSRVNHSSVSTQLLRTELSSNLCSSSSHNQVTTNMFFMI